MQDAQAADQRAIAAVSRGQDGIAEAMEEMMRPGSPLVVSTEHFAESYGEQLVALGLNILRGQAVPPYNFTEQKILTQESFRAEAANMAHLTVKNGKK